MNPAGTYDTAVINGGGQGLYNRLLRDSTDNLLRPTVQMITRASRMPGMPQNVPKKRGGSRHLASANIRMNRPRIGSGVMRIENSHTGGINYTKSVGGLSFANSGY